MNAYADIIQDWVRLFPLAWIPLFVAMDPIGLVPIFLGLTEGLMPEERRRVARQGALTALFVALAFMILGKAIFNALDITVADFQVAGGLIFFLLAAQDLVGAGESVRLTRKDFGVVPLGTPLIAGPATLVALLMLMGSVGVYVTVAAFCVNLFLMWVAFRQSEHIARIVGLRGLRAFSKITSLLLAAFAVSMIRRGIEAMLAH